MLRGMKRAIDVERGIDETSELTVGELRSMATDRAARLVALRRRWEATVDLHALIGALIFEQARLPEWLFRGLMQKLNEQFNNPYVTRFLAVRRPMTFWHDDGRSLRWAAENIDDPAASGGRDTMMKIIPKNPTPGGENRSHPAAATCP